jgi:hypothetical protein
VAEARALRAQHGHVFTDENRLTSVEQEPAAELKIKSGSLKLFVGIARAGHPKQ